MSKKMNMQNILLCMLFLSGCGGPHSSLETPVPHHNITQKVEYVKCPVRSIVSLSEKEVYDVNVAIDTLLDKYITNIKIVLYGKRKPQVEVCERLRQIVVDALREYQLQGRVTVEYVFDKSDEIIYVEGSVFEIDQSKSLDWDYAVGDMDVEKSLPNFGLAGLYNMQDMVVNTADLVHPTSSRHSDATLAVAALTSLYESDSDQGSSGSSGSSSGGSSSSSSSSGSSGSSSSGSSGGSSGSSGF